jgi:hypothetical protein
VSDPIDPATVDASDFTVNGIPANNFTFSNSNTTIAFDFTTSPAGQGVNTFHIAAGAFNCGGCPGCKSQLVDAPCLPADHQGA